MNILKRALNICLTPKTEWPVIAAETTSGADVLTGYVAPLAAIGAISAFVNSSLIGRSLPNFGTYRIPVINGLGHLVFSIAMNIVGVLILAYIINALAPRFKGENNSSQALRVAAYAYTPAWLGGVFHIAPETWKLVFLCALYGAYVLYVGLPLLMKNPEDQTMTYTAAVLVCTLVVSAVIGFASALFGSMDALVGAAVRSGLGS